MSGVDARCEACVRRRAAWHTAEDWRTVVIELRDGSRRSRRPSSTPACTSSSGRTRTCARTSCASRSAAAGSRTTRWTGTARPVANTPKGTEGPDRQYPGSDPEHRRPAPVRRSRRRRRDPAPDDARHHARPPPRHRDRRRPQRDDGVALAGATTSSATGSAARSGSIPTTSPARCARSTKYKDHPRVVQIGIPLQSRELYGKPQFWPLWEAAVDAGPAGGRSHRGRRGHHAVRADTVRVHQDLRAVRRLHVAELPVPPDEHDRRRAYSRGSPDLKFVWADGAADMLTPFIWRMDCFGRPHLEQTPWAPKMPSDYLPGHTYFIQGSDRRPGRCRLRRRVARLHRQGRHGDVRVELSALAAQRAEGAQRVLTPNNATSCAGETPLSCTA